VVGHLCSVGSRASRRRRPPPGRWP
jgi:hypothetical protein